MAVEFASFPQKVFMSEDFVRFDDNEWLTYDKLDIKTVNRLLLNLTFFPQMRKYLNDRIKRGAVSATDKGEQLKAIAKRFFPNCDKTPDIDDNGNINIEIQ